MKREAIFTTAIGAVALTWFGGWSLWDLADLWAMFGNVTFLNILAGLCGIEIIALSLVAYRVHEGPTPTPLPKSEFTVISPAPARADPEPRAENKFDKILEKLDKIGDRVQDLEIARRLDPEEKRPAAPEKLPEAPKQ